MTDQTTDLDTTKADVSHLTYTGPLRRGFLPLPGGRQVRFERGGDPVPVAPDDLVHFDVEEWEGVRHHVAVAADGEMLAVEVPVGVTATLTSEDLSAGTATEVLARVEADPTLVHQALAQEQAGRNRKTVVGPLTEIAAAQAAAADAGESTSHQADPAETTEP